MSSQDSRINELKDSYEGDSSNKRKRYASGLVGIFPCALNSSRSLSVLRDPGRFHLDQQNFAGKELASGQPSSYIESTRPNASLSSQTLNRTEVPRGGNGHPSTGLGSNIASGSELSRNSDSIAMEPAESDKTSEFQEMVTLWLEQELDSLAFGARKLVEGNWANIMKDSYFSELISGQDLAQRWNIEGEKIPNPGDLSTTGESDRTISE